MPSNPIQSLGLLVLGMHRSGTSCLAGMLGCTGFHVGDVDEWNPYNLKGNRENLAASAINEALLRACDADWDRPPEQLRISAHHREDIRRLTDELAASGKPWLLKDPRTLLVLDAWSDTVPELARIGIFRHPLAVARSLQRRDQTDLETGVTLWRAYNERLLRALEQWAFPLIAFSGEPDHLENAVTAALRSLFPTQVNAGSLMPERAGDFFDRSLVHQAQDLRANITKDLAALSLSARQIEEAQETWSRLLEHEGPVRYSQLPEWSAEEAKGSSEIGEIPSFNLQPGSETRVDLTQLDSRIEAAADRIDLFRQGMAFFEAGNDHSGLKSWLSGWCERLPDDPFLHWELANLSWEDGDRAAALDHAERARRLAPSWITPTKALALWAFEAEDWKRAAEANRALYSAQFSRAKDRPPAAELFVDSGEGFRGEEAIEQVLPHAIRSVQLAFDDREMLQGMRQFRLDPLNQPVIVTGLQVELQRAGQQPEPLDPTSSNAELVSEGVYYFTTEDPQLHFTPLPDAGIPVTTIRARYRLAQVGQEVPGELIRRLQALLAEASETSTDDHSPSLLKRLLGERRS